METTYLKIKFNQGATELEVRVDWLDPILDLAILKLNIKDPETLQKAEDRIKKLDALELSREFQPQQTEVFAYGYPSGGTTLSFTKGNISRVEVTSMAVSKESALMIQTSAPINPGNSGGPITIKSPENPEKEICVGIVTQGMPELQNTGYFIPASTVLETIARYEKYHRVQQRDFIKYITAPELSFKWQDLKNKALRAGLGLTDTGIDQELTGILVTSLSRFSCAHGILRTGDIIQKIDGVTVHANGEIEVPELQNPVHFSYLILRKQYFQSVVVSVLRKNKDAKTFEELDLNISLHRQIGQGFLGVKFQEPMKYHIHPSGKGALVFIRCSLGVINAFKNQQKPSVPSFFGKLSETDSHEVVVLYQIISSVETDGYESLAIQRGAHCLGDRVMEVNGHAINHLYDLIHALSDRLKTSEIKFANGRVLYTSISSPEDVDDLKVKQRITFFTSPSVRVKNPAPVLEEIKKLGERENNKFDFLKPTTTKVIESFGNDELLAPTPRA